MSALEIGCSKFPGSIPVPGVVPGVPAGHKSSANGATPSCSDDVPIVDGRRPPPPDCALDGEDTVATKTPGGPFIQTTRSANGAIHSYS